MKLWTAIFLFFIFSVLLIFISIEQNAHVLYREVIEKIQISKIQNSSAKTYKRERKEYTPSRSFFLGQLEIEKILLKEPIHFEINNSSLLEKSTLIKIVKIINHVREDVVLSILAHTDANGTAQHNLYLSQKRADQLKEYFISKTNLPLIVAIGYGEVFSFKNRRIEINLKRIKH